jgi:hypothetical protein
MLEFWPEAKSRACLNICLLFIVGICNPCYDWLLDVTILVGFYFWFLNGCCCFM